MGGSGGLSGRLEAGGGVAPRAPWIKKWYCRLSWLKAAARLHLLCWVCANEARKAATCRLGEAQYNKIQHLQLRKQRQVHMPRFSATGVIFLFYCECLIWSRAKTIQSRLPKDGFCSGRCSESLHFDKVVATFFSQKKWKIYTRWTSHIN